MLLDLARDLHCGREVSFDVELNCIDAVVQERSNDKL